METTRQRDTPPEIAVRKEVHRRGLRYCVDAPVEGVTRARPDLLFTTEKVAVFVDGCFWHCCPVHGTMPKSNREWWESKLRQNVERDERHRVELESAGWIVLRIWEHESPQAAAHRVEAAVRERRSTSD